MTTDVHTLSGAYALDALSDQEAADFREHLRGCQACRDEVRELRAAERTRARRDAGGVSASADPIWAAAARSSRTSSRQAWQPRRCSRKSAAS